MTQHPTAYQQDFIKDQCLLVMSMTEGFWNDYMAMVIIVVDDVNIVSRI